MVLDTKADCCGCGACALSCPTKAICMERDDKGFNYPVIDESSCIHCDKCAAVCPVHNRKKDVEVQKAFVGRHKKRDVVLKSMSGGAFTLLSDEILKQHGVVYGVVFDQHQYRAHYARADQESKRNAMRGSKYVEAELGSVYRSVRRDIQKNRIVLFAGTPCHVAGLKAYLSDIDCENLFTVDILCSNVCSSKFFQKYIGLMKKIYRKPIKEFSFRDQSRTGWRVQEESFYVGDRKVYSHLYRDLYYSRLFSRPSCDECIYRDIHREGDVTIGDAWGSKAKDTNGLSIIMCNTFKGMKFFDKVRENGHWDEVDISDYLQLGLTPHKFTIQREKIWKHINRYGLLYVLLMDIGRTQVIERVKEYKFNRKRRA